MFINVFLDIFPYVYDSTNNCDIIGLPYMQNATTMYIFLPRDSTPEKARKLQSTLTSSKIEKLIQSMRVTKAKISLPRMNLSDSYQLKGLLQANGVKNLFDSKTCDLSVMSTRKIFKSEHVDQFSAVQRIDILRAAKETKNYGAFPDKVIHKVFLGVDEMGTEGAATNPVNTNDDNDQLIFRVDTPFMFIIRHDPTKAPLFYGVVYDPTK